MPRVLVTGAGGFLGRYAVRALAAEGWEVVGTGRSTPEVEGLADAVACDLLSDTDRARLVEAVGAEVLLHLAWHDDPRGRWHAAENLDWVAASLSLARGFAAAGGRRMVFGSSCAVYDFAARARHSEDDPLRPGSLYGAAKAATGSLLQAGSGAMGLSVAEARLFFCYGAGEPHGRLVPDLLAGLRRGEAVDCTDGQQRRDYLHAADIGRAFALLARSDVTGPVNVGSGMAIPVAALIEEVAGQMGRPDLPRLGVIERSATDPEEIVADVSRLDALGFMPEMDLAEGVAETLAREFGRG